MLVGAFVQIKQFVYSRALVIALLAVVFVSLGLGIVIFRSKESLSVVVRAYYCERAHEQRDAKIACWHNIIGAEMDAQGIDAALNAFALIYRRFPTFADSGCHRQAHQLGDRAFYAYSVAEQIPLSQLEFPESTATCGNGFFHGFIEHLIQNMPAAKDIHEQCEALIANQADINPYIRSACYHASGHGLARAELDRSEQGSDINLKEFFRRPLAECALLNEVTGTERTNCAQGVMNVVVNWMADGRYGLDFNTAAPFEVCDEVFTDARYRAMCMVEIGRKADRLSGFDPEKLRELLAPLDISTALRKEIMIVAIGGMVQQIVGQGIPSDLFMKCTEFNVDDLQTCQLGIVRGLILNGSPRNEFEHVVAFCRSHEVRESGNVDHCWRGAGYILRLFYTEAQFGSFCSTLLSAECTHLRDGADAAMVREPQR